MGLKTVFTDSTVSRYVKAIKESPRELILNRKLLLTAALYAMAGIPISKFPLSGADEAEGSG